jgi:ribosome-binding protein aMBF1 (putative translation factor)
MLEYWHREVRLGNPSREIREKHMAKKTEESFGERIRRLREANGISMETFSRDTGYPEEFLKDIEDGKTAPPVAVVLQLSRFFNVDVEQSGTGGKEAARKRTTSHKKRVASYAYEPLTKGQKKHLRAYRVTIDPETEHKGVEYHHEGEEFIYVLEGSLKIKVGQNTSTIKSGGYINFDSSLSHKLSNPTGEKAELLVVIYMP